MSGPQQYRAVPPGAWTPRSANADAERWRRIGEAANADLEHVQQAARQVRHELLDRDLTTTLRALSALADGSHALARFVQADLEAVRLLRAAGEPVPDDTMAWFPVAPGALHARRGPEGRWSLDGQQPRSVHAAAVDRGLVVAGTDEGDRLFSFAMNAPGVVRDATRLQTITPQNPNGPVRFTAVDAEPVGTAAWWATRAESWEGLLLDAAVWFGACVWLCRSMEATLARRTDGHDLGRVGGVDVWVFSARLALRDAVAVVEADPTGGAAELAARRAAAVTASTADTVIRQLALLSDARAPGSDVWLPSRVGQLQIALQRFDAEANLRALGRLVADGAAGRDGGS